MAVAVAVSVAVAVHVNLIGAVAVVVNRPGRLWQRRWSAGHLREHADDARQEGVGRLDRG